VAEAIKARTIKTGATGKMSLRLVQQGGRIFAWLTGRSLLKGSMPTTCGANCTSDADAQAYDNEPARA